MSTAEILVLPSREPLAGLRLEGRVVVVLDIIFATTTIVTALQAGARRVLPAADRGAALELAARLPDALLAGEKDAVVLEGFAHYAPLRLRDLGLRARTLVYATTNGTPALLQAGAGAGHVFPAALLNRMAVCRFIAERHAGSGVLIVCAGSPGGFNIEDFYGAGAFVEGLLDSLPGAWSLSDAALAARAVFRQYTLGEALHGSRVGRLMHGLELADDVGHAAQMDTVDLVASLRGGAIESRA